ncbi:hypothetical protein [Subtercola boreus]|nr:hypothetical protein [Subtercola boreus]
MSHLLDDAIAGGLVVTSVWTVGSVALALLLGRVVRARETYDLRDR